MPQRKGQTGNPNGRPKGQPNKTTAELRQALSLIVSNNIGKMQTCLETIAKTNPAKAFELYIRLADLIIPRAIAEVDPTPQPDWYKEQAKKMMQKVD